MKTRINVLWLFLIVAALTSCGKKGDPVPEGTGECWYKVTIDGETTMPNKFGQDKMVITDDLAFGISQAKANPQHEGTFGFAVYDVLNSDVPVGTSYPIKEFQSISLNNSPHSPLPYYMFDKYHDAGGLTLTVVENSKQRLRLNVSGTVMKFDDIVPGGTAEEVGLVSVEAEITIGRKPFDEVPFDGVTAIRTVCECRE